MQKGWARTDEFLKRIGVKNTKNPVCKWGRGHLCVGGESLSDEMVHSFFNIPLIEPLVFGVQIMRPLILSARIGGEDKRTNQLQMISLNLFQLSKRVSICLLSK